MKLSIFIFLISMIFISCDQDIRVDNSLIEGKSLLLFHDLVSEISPENGAIIRNIDYFNSFSGSINKLIKEERDYIYSNGSGITILDSKFELKQDFYFPDTTAVLDFHFPNTSNAFFSLAGSDSLHILDRINLKIASLKFKLSVQPNKIFSIGNRLFVSDAEANLISVFATNSNAELSVINTSYYPVCLSKNIDGTELVVTSKSSDGKYYLEFYDSQSYFAIKILELPYIEGIEYDKFVATGNTESFGFVKSNKGLYRIELRFKIRIDLIGSNTEIVKDLFYDIEENTLYYLSNLNNRFSLRTIHFDNQSSELNVELPKDSYLIYPI